MAIIEAHASIRGDFEIPIVSMRMKNARKLFAFETSGSIIIFCVEIFVLKLTLHLSLFKNLEILSVIIFCVEIFVLKLTLHLSLFKNLEILSVIIFCVEIFVLKLTLHLSLFKNLEILSVIIFCVEIFVLKLTLHLSLFKNLEILSVVEAACWLENLYMLSVSKCSSVNFRATRV